MTVPQRKRYRSIRLLKLSLHKAGFFIFIPSCLYGRTFKWPKSIIQIKLQRIKVRVPAYTTVLFALLTGGFNMLSLSKLLKPWLVPGRLSQPLPCGALGVMGEKTARERLFLSSSFPSLPAPAVRVTQERLRTSQIETSIFPGPVHGDLPLCSQALLGANQFEGVYGWFQKNIYINYIYPTDIISRENNSCKDWNTRCKKKFVTEKNIYIYVILLFHYYVVLPYKVNRTSKIRGHNIL